jgi:cardiolipin synthase
MWKSLLIDLASAKRFIFMEYFIIEDGKFWSSKLKILKEKAKEGVIVRVLYDDIGCMSTLPPQYCKELRKFGIESYQFSRLRGNADSEFNNRSHRKITVIDGKIGYTGGINIADEYVNEVKRFGHWKDTAIRLEGEAVWELTRLFLFDFGITSKTMPQKNPALYPENKKESDGYLIPFGDGPRPIYSRRVGKSVIQSIVNAATEHVYITTPYLIIDNETCTCLESAALRGVDVKIITPHIPDKKTVYMITRSFYKRLMNAGVKIYEYTPGFIHAKMYVADGKYAMIGTINLDYRSLVHHFENGVWIYSSHIIGEITRDINETLQKCEQVLEGNLKTNLLTKFVRAIIRIFAPML